MGGFNPQAMDIDFEDIELGKFGDRLKKAAKGVSKALDKVTEVTITKPSMMIGKAVGGKKGEAIGKKLGGFTSKVTKFGTGAALAAPLLPLAASPTLLTTAATAAGAGMLGKRLLGKKRKTAAKASSKPKKKKAKAKKKAGKGSCGASNALASKVAAMLAVKLGSPLAQANRALKLAELQRQATYEHHKLMGDADFREKVLRALVNGAQLGDERCERTVRVIMAR